MKTKRLLNERKTIIEKKEVSYSINWQNTLFLFVIFFITTYSIALLYTFISYDNNISLFFNFNNLEDWKISALMMILLFLLIIIWNIYILYSTFITKKIFK